MSFLPTKLSLSILKNRSVLAATTALGISYLLIQIYLFNPSLFSQTILGDFPVSYKIKLSFDLIIGYFMMFPLPEIFFTLLAAILVGLNLALMIVLMQRVRNSGAAKLSVGGVGIVALMSTGCPGCGLTLLSILGPSSGAIALTLHNPLIQLFIISTLVFSSLYNLKRIETNKMCKLSLKKRR